MNADLLQSSLISIVPDLDSLRISPRLNRSDSKTTWQALEQTVMQDPGLEKVDLTNTTSSFDKLYKSEDSREKTKS